MSLSAEDCHYFINAMQAFGVSTERLKTKAGWQVLQSWKEAFLPECHRATGHWPSGDHLWTCFDLAHIHCQKYVRAEAAFDAASKSETYCFTNDGKPVFRCSGCSGLLAHDLRAMLFASPGIGDLYLADIDLNWTFVLSHEDTVYFRQRSQSII